MYDYVDGKSDWMAYGLAVEGDAGPFAGQAVSTPATCRVDATLGQARATVGDTAEWVVIVDPAGLVVGIVGPEALGGADDDPVLDVMAVVPSTVRPSVELSSLVHSGADRVLVTSSDGRLMGQVVIADLTGPEHHHDHDHDAEMDALFAETMAAVRERFGDRDPSADEMRSFLRDRLVAGGRTPEEADRFLQEMDDDG